MSLVGRLLLALWAGLVLTVGLVAAPLLFAVLDDRHLAGLVAGRLFAMTAGLSMALALGVVFADRGWRSGRGLAVTLAPAVLLVIGTLGIRPLLESARSTAGAGSPAFLLWHGVSTLIYGVVSVWVLARLIRALRV